jgi:hypothetical protein
MVHTAHLCGILRAYVCRLSMTSSHTDLQDFGLVQVEAGEQEGRVGRDQREEKAAWG